MYCVARVSPARFVCALLILRGIKNNLGRFAVRFLPPGVALCLPLSLSISLAHSVCDDYGLIFVIILT